MANPLTELLLPAVTARFVLLANHVLAAAPVATERLKAHRGRLLRVEVEGWRGPLPVPPPLVLRITPAGLLEAEAPLPDVHETAADLRLRVDASQPIDAARRVAGGELPAVQIDGDVGFAADVNWVIANVRWDIAADLERVVGPAVAEGLSRAGERAVATARAIAQGAAGVLRKP
jgi:ubiquinone biosynthesis accessory factor UbiJ